MDNFSSSTFRSEETDCEKNEIKNLKKRVNMSSVDSINMDININKGDTNSQGVLLKQLNSKAGASKSKKCSSKLKDKINGIKKGYKPIAPYPSADNQKITTLQNPIQKIVSPHINPIFIVKIDDTVVGNEKQKVPDYLDYCEKKIDNSECVLSCDYNNLANNNLTNLRDKRNFVAKTKCYKCYNCPFTTLSKEYLNFHFQKKQKCSVNNEVFHCPACKNIFFSLTPLRVHLVQDHKMIMKEVKVIVQSFQEVALEGDNDKVPCIYQANQIPNVNEGMFNSDVSAMELPVTDVDNREDIDKSYVGSITNREMSESREIEEGGNLKRPTMLESYLDDINNKAECAIPPTFNHNGSALLENTFNFTAPVSEQLPSIQPPPAHSASNSLLDQSHLMVEHENHNFIGMTSDFDAREQGNFKANDPPHYGEDPNMILSNSSYLSSHLQDIPIITLEENNLEKTPSSILSHDINIEDFSSYQENGPTSLENECPPSVEDDYQEEKKKLKKLGVGFRCDINGCKVRLQSEKNIQYHRRCHEGTLYNCPECCKDCSTWVSLSSHLWQAHKIDMELYKCDQCPYKTPSYSRLTNIHRGIHGKARPFLCDICGKGFKTVKQMRNHKNIHKAKMVRMSVCHCEICGRTVADKRQLELHINNTHKKKKPYLCYMCGYASAVKHSLVVHMRRHTGEKPYQCEKCEYKTADHNALRRHKMKHSGVRNYKCSHCSYTCIQASTYKVHIKTKHPGLEADIIFSCGQCNFQTLNRGSYLSHTSEHENVNGNIRKPTRSVNPKPDVPTGTNDYFGETNRIDLVGPIISERVVETIVDLSGAHSLLEQDEYYNVERITGHLDGTQELKFKNSGIT
ncbi:hypothetical protein RUM43_002955 [Polyplax serrata]|uniref:C2H2-type domain-containing protein n=1 Tax=Polyplax serrata TaxID=468196 RepID=A0AAN8RWB4_POLSC